MADLNLTASRALGKFYVYIYRDPRPGKNGNPIYVGKGMPGRSRAQIHWARGSHNAFFSAILAKIRDAGLEPIIEIAGYFDDEALAFALEMELIAKFGRRNIGTGCLTNLTDGGEGTTGYVPSAEIREAARVRFKITQAKQWDDPQFRTKALSNLELGRAAALSDSTVEQKRVSAIRAAKAALANDADRSAAQSRQRAELRKAAWQDPEIREKYLRSHDDPVRKAAKSASLKASWVIRRERNSQPQLRVATGQYRKRED